MQMLRTNTSTSGRALGRGGIAAGTGESGG